MKIKYAIYKSSVGLYAKEYFDKIDPELFNDDRYYDGTEDQFYCRECAKKYGKE